VADGRVERRPHGLANRPAGAALCDIRQRERDGDPDDRRSLEVPEASGVSGSQRGDGLVERVDRRLRHAHVDTAVDGDDRSGVAALRGHRDRDVARRSRRR